MIRRAAIAVTLLCFFCFFAVSAAADDPLYLPEEIYRSAALDAISQDSLGYGINPVAISGDSSVMVAGAPSGTVINDADGAAYVFCRAECVGWPQSQKLAPSVAINAYAWFGFSVGVSEDGSYIAVGAPLEDIGGKDRVGAVYVYYYSGGTWGQQQRIPHPSAQEVAHFGSSVAISDDGDRLVIGARGDDDAATFAGAVHVYSRAGATWSLEQTFTGGDTAADDNFGVSVAMSGDGGTIIAGSPGAGTVGAAYVFTRSGTTWSQQQKISAGSNGDDFGFPVNISNDGLTTLISAIDHGTKGALYVYDYALGSWSLDQKIIPVDAVTNDRFGFSASINDDKTLILATSPRAASTTGASYLFSNTTGTWLQHDKWFSPSSTSAAGDEFGFSGALSSDGVYAAVGCPGDNDVSGAIFVSYLSDGTIAQSLINFVRYYLREPSPVVWQDSELLAWLNHGVMDLVSRSQCLQYSEDITLATGTGSYDITGDYIYVAGAIYNDAKGLIRGNTESLGNQFHDIGEPNAFVPWDDDVWIYPRPDADANGNALTIYGLERPDTMTIYSCLEIPEIFARPLVYYAVAQALYKVGKFSKAREIMMWYFEEADRMRMDYFTPTKELAAKSK